ncbi:MAG TPA: sensor histidine kinase [Desulfomicrobiaceae bacterium]|nr:sensor histidine kinase [Desulfomicrobiaceae bacterium]
MTPHRYLLIAAAFFLGCVLSPLPCGGAPPPPKKHILLVHSYHQGLSWTDSITRGVRSVLTIDDSGIELHIEYMDTKRLTSPGYLDLLQKTFQNKYAELGIDLIITADDNALTFVRSIRDSVFPGLPLVYCGVNTYEENGIPSIADATGVVELPDFSGTLHIALKLHPQTRQVYIVTDQTTTGRATREGLKHVLNKFNGRAEFIFLTGLTTRKLVHTLETLPRDSLVLVLVFTRDGAGRTYSFAESMQMIASHCPAPIYSFWDFYFGHGIVGGSLLSGQMQGELAARLALRILDGQPPADIPVITESTRELLFDHRQMARFGLLPKDLPPDSFVRYQPTGFYAENRELVLGTVAVFMTMVLFIFLLLFHILRRRRAEQALRSSERKLRALNENLEHIVSDRTKELRESLEDLQQAQEHLVQAEKMAALGGLVAGVAHEINTPVGIGVTAASYLDEKTAALKSSFESGGLTESGFAEYLSAAEESARTILINLKRAAELISSFKQVAVDQNREEQREFNLREYLEEILVSLRPKFKHTGHRIELNCPDDLVMQSLPGVLMQVMTNLIMNSLLHGFREKEAGTVTLDVTRDRDMIRFLYRDDGVGMTEEQVRKVYDPFYTTRRRDGGTGLGMHIVYNLVTRTLGGTIICASEPGQGAVFTITIPRIRETSHEQPR